MNELDKRKAKQVSAKHYVSLPVLQNTSIYFLFGPYNHLVGQASYTLLPLRLRYYGIKYTLVWHSKPSTFTPLLQSHPCHVLSSRRDNVPHAGLLFLRLSWHLYSQIALLAGRKVIIICHLLKADTKLTVEGDRWRRQHKHYTHSNMKASSNSHL